VGKSVRIFKFTPCFFTQLDIKYLTGQAGHFYRGKEDGSFKNEEGGKDEIARQ
jgi:hypothetical protein